MQADLNLVVKGAALMAAGIIASKILGMIFQIILVNILTPDELGLFFLATGIIAFFVILANFGLIDSLTRFVAFYLEKKDFPRIKGTIFSAIKIHFILCVLIGILVFLLSDWIAGAIFAKPQLGVLLKLLAITVPLTTIGGDFQSAMDGFKQIKYKIYIRRVIQLLSKIVILLALALAGFSLIGAILTFVLTEAVAFIFGLFFLEKKVFSITNPKITAIPTGRELVKFSAPLFLTGIFSYAFVNFDVILLGFFAPAYNAGIYGVALTTANFGQAPLEALAVLVIPITTSYFAMAKIGEFKKFFGTISRWLFLVAFPLTALLIVFAEPIQVLLFGKLYAGSALALDILLVGFFVNTITGPTQQSLIAAGKTKLILGNAILLGILSIGLNSILAPLFAQPVLFLPAGSEHIGTAIATAATNAAWGILTLAELYVLFRIQPFTKNHLKVLCSAAMAVAATVLIAETAIPFSIMSAITMGRIFILLYLVAAAAIFVVLYFPLLLIFRSFHEEDLQIMLAIERKTGFRVEFLRNIAKKIIK
ncbi:MAG: flippase [Candidatus ainarchaeum sp.]|nr:flippase [Candidatus ainarchaeum sp.]